MSKKALKLGAASILALGAGAAVEIGRAHV